MMKSSFKDKILGLFGSFGIVVWYIIIGVLYVLPFVILHLPWWGIAIAMIAFSIPLIGEFSRSLRRSTGANERSLLTHKLVQRLGADQSAG